MKRIRIIPVIRSVASTNLTRFVSVAISLAPVVGCGAPDGTSSAHELEIAKLTQNFDESTCATTAADVSLGTNGDSTSPNGSYNHTTCTNAYIGTMTSSGGYHAYAGYKGPIVPQSWGCDGMWATVSVWKWNGSSFVHQSTSTSYGVNFGSGCAAPVGTVEISGSSASYKILGAAGYVTLYEPVDIGGAADPG